MLVPLTDTTSMYAVLMLELIKDHHARTAAHPSRPAPVATSRWHGVRTFFSRTPARRRHASATTSA